MISNTRIVLPVDIALTLVAKLMGPEVAHLAQLSLEYAPQPPLNAGRPQRLPPEFSRNCQGAWGQSMQEYRIVAERAAAKLGLQGKVQL